MALPRLPRRAPLPEPERYPTRDPVATARFIEHEDGSRVRVVEAGHASGPAVVLLHGWGGCAYSFRRLLLPLAEAGCRAIAPDLLGHGSSDRVPDARVYERTSVVGHLLRLLDACEVRDAVLVGQSMGGALALDLVRAAPARFAAALLLAPVGFTPLRRVQVARTLPSGEWGAHRVPRWVVRVMLHRVYGRLRQWEDRDLDEYWAPLREAGTTAALLGWVRGYDWTIREPLPDRPPAVRLHVLFGERDRLIPSAAAVTHAVRFAGAVSEVVRDGGHLLAEEAPERVVQAVLELAQRRP